MDTGKERHVELVNKVAAAIEEARDYGLQFYGVMELEGELNIKVLSGLIGLEGVSAGKAAKAVYILYGFDEKSFHAAHRALLENKRVEIYESKPEKFVF